MEPVSPEAGPSRTRSSQMGSGGLRRFQGSNTFVSLNSRLASNAEEEENVQGSNLNLNKFGVRVLPLVCWIEDSGEFRRLQEDSGCAPAVQACCGSSAFAERSASPGCTALVTLRTDPPAVQGFV